MTRISIAPSAVRDAGLAAINAADELQLQSVALRSVILPDMPPAMAARASAGLGAVAARLANAVQTLEHAGAELQLCADAAEAADGSSAAGLGAAGSTLGSAVVTSTVVMAGGVQAVTTITVDRGGVTAVGGPSGMKVTIPELAREPGSDVLRPQSATEPPDPHETAISTPAATKDIPPAGAVDGAPAAAVQQAVGTGGGGADGSPAPVELGSTITAGDEADPASVSGGLHTAAHTQTGLPVPAELPQDHGASQQTWACWMAGSAVQDGIPPALPVMLALAGSGVRNMPAGSHEVGLFGLDPRRSYAPPGHGQPADAQPSADWWADHPDAQLDELVSRLRSVGGGIRDAHLDDAGAMSRWASEALPGIHGDDLSHVHDAANALVSNCQHASAPSGAAAAGAADRGALAMARSQLGVHEVGTNAGPKVDEYLRTAGVGSGNPWCASFVTWSLQQTGHEMPGQGWAAVTNWVQAAEHGQHGLSIVDAAHARPGDIVAYDWGHGNDFGADGHIGFLDSKVDPSGQFMAVEGNAHDAVTRMSRSLGEANVVFIRVGA